MLTRIQFWPTTDISAHSQTKPFLLFSPSIHCMILTSCDFALVNQFQTSNLKDGAHPIRTGVAAEEVKQRVVQTKGMFATAKRIYTSFSSIRRPSADFVVQQFKEMEKEGLGVLRNAHRSTIFFKKLPEFLIHEEYKLGKHNITVDDYRKLLPEVDEFYDERQSAEVMKLYPWKDDALRYHYIDPEPIVEG